MAPIKSILKIKKGNKSSASPHLYISRHSKNLSISPIPKAELNHNPFTPDNRNSKDRDEPGFLPLINQTKVPEKNDSSLSPRFIPHDFPNSKFKKAFPPDGSKSTNTIFRHDPILSRTYSCI